MRPDSDATVAAARQSIQDYRAGIGDDFEPCALAYAHGQALRLAGDPAGALDTWLAALDAPTAAPWPWLMNALVALARTTGAAPRVAAALAARTARHPELALWRGHLLRTTQDPLAVSVLMQARDTLRGPLHHSATTELLQALDAEGRHAEALALCDESAHPELAASAVALLCRLGRPAEALARADALVQAAPGLAAGWLNRGAAQLHLGRRAAADTSLARCLQLQPSLAGAVAALRARHPT